MEFLKENALWLLLGFAGLMTFLWLFAFKKRLRAKWYVLLLLSALHIIVGVFCVRFFAFLESFGKSLPGAQSLFGAVFFMPLLYFFGALTFKRDIRTVFDIFTVPLVFTLACARVNCLISGCCTGLIISGIHSHIVRWPTREAELVFYGAFLIPIIYKIVKTKTNGEVYPIYLISYGIFRFVIEWFRTATVFVGPFHISHFWATLAIIIGTSFYFEMKSNEKNNKSRSKNYA